MLISTCILKEKIRISLTPEKTTVMILPLRGAVMHRCPWHCILFPQSGECDGPFKMLTQIKPNDKYTFNQA